MAMTRSYYTKEPTTVDVLPIIREWVESPLRCQRATSWELLEFVRVRAGLEGKAAQIAVEALKAIGAGTIGPTRELSGGYRL